MKACGIQREQIALPPARAKFRITSWCGRSDPASPIGRSRLSLADLRNVYRSCRLRRRSIERLFQRGETGGSGRVHRYEKHRVRRDGPVSPDPSPDSYTSPLLERIVPMLAVHRDRNGVQLSLQEPIIADPLSLKVHVPVEAETLLSIYSLWSRRSRQKRMWRGPFRLDAFADCKSSAFAFAPVKRRDRVHLRSDVSALRRLESATAECVRGCSMPADAIFDSVWPIERRELKMAIEGTVVTAQHPGAEERSRRRER